MCRRSIVILWLVSSLGGVGVAAAGDEVDYSAPYVTVENGELVTRYPAKPHADDDGMPRGAAASDAASTSLASPRAGLSTSLIGATLVLLIAGAWIGWSRRRRSTRNEP